MSWLEFTATLVSALAWPVTAVVIAVMFRKHIQTLLSLLSRLRAGPVEMWWDRQLSEAEAELGTSTARSKGGPTVADLTSTAQHSPATAVLEAFARVEAELQRVVGQAVSATEMRGAGPVALARMGHEHDVVTAETLRAVEGLAVLRNLVEHGREDDVTVDKALDFVAMVDAVLFALRHQPPPTD